MRFSQTARPRSVRSRRSRFGRSTPPARERAVLSLEQLEPRRLMATTATLSSNTLSVSLPVTFAGNAEAVITWQTMKVGQFTWTNASGDIRAVGLPESFNSFCIEGLQTFSYGRTYTFPNLTTAINANPMGGASVAMGVARANLLTQFWNQFGAADPNVGFATATDAAAFQLAIWEIVNDATPAGNGMTFDLAAGKFQVGPAAQSAAAVAKAGQWLQAFDVTVTTERSWVVHVLESSTAQDQATVTPEPPEKDTGGDGDPCEPCSVNVPDDATGMLPFTDMIVSGGGGGLTPSLVLQRTQPAPGATSQGVPSASFGNGWSRAIPSFTMQGTDPANPTSVTLTFSGSDIRVFRNVPDAGGQPDFYRATGQGTTDRLIFSGGQYLLRTASGATVTFNGFGADIPLSARGQLAARTDASDNRLVTVFNPDGSTDRLMSFTAAAAGQSTLVRRIVFTYYDGTSSLGTLGDLASIQVLDPAGALLDAKSYRYTTSPSGQSLLHSKG